MSFQKPYRKPFTASVGSVTIADQGSSSAGDFEYVNSGEDRIIKKVFITGGAAEIDTVSIGGVTVTLSNHTTETTVIDLEEVFGSPVSLKDGDKIDAIVSNTSGGSLDITLHIFGVSATVM